MNEFKCKIWDISKKQFIPQDVYAILSRTDFGAFGIMIKDWANYKEGQYFYNNSQALVLFTGLKDRNGKELWEGDILCVSHLEGTKHQARMEMTWDNERAGWASFHPHGAFEVIGNVFENPELL